MRIWKIIITAFFIINQSLSGTGGSNISRYGLGDIQYLSGSYSIGMAGTSVSVLSKIAANRLNPAGWTIIDRTRFSIDVYYQGYSIKSANDKNYLSGIAFQGFDLSIPISTEHGIVFGAGLIPYSKVNYNILVKDSGVDYAYDLFYQGEGGLSAAHLGVSGKLFSDLHLGIKLNYLFGNIFHNIKQTVTSGTATSFELYRSTLLYGLNGTIGLIYSGLGKNFGLEESKKLSVGLVISPSSNLNARNERAYNYYNNTTLLSQDTISNEEGKISIPLSIGFGASFLQNERYQIACDYYLQNWGKSKFFGATPDQIRNSSRFSIGAEIVPLKGIKISEWERMGARVGFFYNQSYYKIQGNAINEFGFSTGFDFPIYGETRLSIGLEYTLRDLPNLENDKIFKVSLGLNVSELWFVRSEED
jgi:hypothetical protein